MQDIDFSAAEEFCYDLQNLDRATIIGETTGGGAHGTFSQNAGYGFVVYIHIAQPLILSQKQVGKKLE